MILLEDNREALYQWDLNQRLILIDIEAGTEVQISDSNNTDEYCLTSKAYNENGNVYAKIPNIYLQKVVYFTYISMFIKRINHILNIILRLLFCLVKSHPIISILKQKNIL